MLSYEKKRTETGMSKIIRNKNACDNILKYKK